jgi:hypothetical protein
MAAGAVTQNIHSGSRPRSGLDRKALAILVPIGPLAIAVLRGILPYNTTDSNTVMAARVAAHQGTEAIVIWLTFIALLTLIPDVITVGMQVQGPRWPDETGIGRHSCCPFELTRLWLRTEAWVRSRRLRTVLSWPGLIWGLWLIQQLAPSWCRPDPANRLRSHGCACSDDQGRLRWSGPHPNPER